MSISFTGKQVDIDKKGLLRGIGQEPPSGLVPIGNGWYATADKPADPRDCERYPDSPWCGGNPFSSDPIGLDLEPTIDSCGVSLTINPTLGFIKLPPASIAWIAPHCREEYEKPDFPPPPPIPDDVAEPPISLALPRDINPNAIVLAGIVVSYSYFENFLGLDSTTPYLSRRGFTTTGEVLYPGTVRIRDFHFPNAFAQSVADMNVFVSSYGTIESTSSGGDSLRRDEPVINNYSHKPIDALGHKGYLLYGRWGNIRADWQGLYRFEQGLPPMAGPNGLIYRTPQQAGFAWYFRYEKTQYNLCYLKVISGGNPYASPANDWNKKECCMTCCTTGYQSQRKQEQDNAELLRLMRRIDKKLGNFPIQANIFDTNEDKEGAQSQRISLADLAVAIQKIIHEIQKALKCIGIDQLPIYTPNTVIDDESNGLLGDLGDLKNQTFKQKIESIAELLTWKIKNDYEIFGKWQETIEIEDSDPTQKGNQSKKIILPNMARTFRELVLLSSTQIKVLGMLFDTTLKMYIDLANTKISAAICEAILRDVQDYLDYPTVVKKLDVPLGISIPSDGTPNDDREDLERFLQNSIAKAKFDDWTGEGSQAEILLNLLRMAEGYLGQNFGKI